MDFQQVKYSKIQIQGKLVEDSSYLQSQLFTTVYKWSSKAISDCQIKLLRWNLLQEILIYIRIDSFQKLELNILFLISKVNHVSLVNQIIMKTFVLKIKIAQILQRFIMNTLRMIFEFIQILSFCFVQL